MITNSTPSTYRLSRRVAWACIAAALCLITFVGVGPASAQEASPEQRAEFNRLVRERNQLQRELVGLDERAARIIKNEEDPLEINAQQVSVQDKLDLVQLRLEILSTRYGLALPAVPGQGDEEAQTIDGKARERVLAEKAFSRGRQRAVAVMQRESVTFMKSLDFESFLTP